jgi:regulator of replication initiation timing
MVKTTPTDSHLSTSNLITMYHPLTLTTCKFLYVYTVYLLSLSISFSKLNDTPHLEDLINLIKAVENVNQQLLAENNILRSQCDNLKANVFKLIEENTQLHKELKNTTIVEILNEFENNQSAQQQQQDQLDSSRVKSKK